jgi:hypothetical protein
MANKPFSERANPTAAPESDQGGGGGGDKDDFEEKVQQDKQNFEKLSKDLADKQGKPEKDEAADKFATDKSNVDKYWKEKAEHKEQHDKIRKDIIKEVAKDFDVVKGDEVTAGPGPVAGGVTTAGLHQRIGALEQIVAHLMHFIPQAMRPDLSKGALTGEPKAPASGPSKTTEKPTTPKPPKP